MNGYKLTAASYKAYLEKNPDEPNKESILRNIKANEYLAECSEDDIYTLYDTGAFNDITEAYCKKAMLSAGLTQKQVAAVLDEIRWLHDTMGASTIQNT